METPHGSCWSLGRFRFSPTVAADDLPEGMGARFGSILSPPTQVFLCNVARGEHRNDLPKTPNES